MQSVTPARVLWQLVKWTFLSIGPLFLGGALIDAHFTQKFLRESVTVDGRIVGLKPVPSTRRVTFAPVFRFPVEGSHPVTVVSNTSSNPPVFKPGEVVKVHYRKDHPENAMIDSFGQLWLGDVVFASVGVLSVGISVLILVAARKRKRPSLAVADDGSGIVRRG
jgi:hypothetical protein